MPQESFGNHAANATRGTGYQGDLALDRKVTCRRVHLRSYSQQVNRLLVFFVGIA
jgi:hypothetical protein